MLLFCAQKHAQPQNRAIRFDRENAAKRKPYVDMLRNARLNQTSYVIKITLRNSRLHFEKCIHNKVNKGKHHATKQVVQRTFENELKTAAVRKFNFGT